MKKPILFFNLVLVSFLACFSLISCGEKVEMEKTEEVAETTQALPERPNILWLVTEDMGRYLAAFGDSTVATPNLSRLAREGVTYPNLYSVSGVCAPSRAAIATGMYPTAIGAHHMRTNSYTDVTGLFPYEAVPPPEVKMVSELLRINGYYCTNNSKEDYQFKAPVTAWDDNGNYAHWRNRKENQPFFSVFNFTQTHESGLFEPYGFKKEETRHYREGDTTYTWESGQMTEAETAVHLPKDTKFDIPPYLPDTEIVRRDLWKMYNNIAEMDKQVGAVLQQLEDDGLLEDTIVFFYGDHGGPLPRQKRLVYDSGLNTPLIIRFPQKISAGTTDGQLLSFVDFAPTLLSLIGVSPPEHLQGEAFLGEFKAEKERTFIHAAADRFDGFTDVIRAVRDKRFKYIRNYRPEQGYYLPVAYRERIPTMQELLRLRKEGKLDSVQSLWFREKKDAEELYDLLTDRHEIHNLANDPRHKEKLTELQTEMDRWIKQVGDRPNLPEEDLIAHLWNGERSQPETAPPSIALTDGEINLSSRTDGASLGYRIIAPEKKLPKVWRVYTEPFEIPRGSSVQAQAHRIGFTPSEIVENKDAIEE